MGLQGGGTTPKHPTTSWDARAAVNKHRAVQAFQVWLASQSTSAVMTLDQAARSVGLSKYQMVKALQKNPEIQDLVIGHSALKAKIGVDAFVNQALDAIGTRAEDGRKIPIDERRRLAEFLARLAGGGFEKKEAPTVNILNLIPRELPPGIARIQDAIQDAEFTVRKNSTLEDLEA